MPNYPSWQQIQEANQNYNVSIGMAEPTSPVPGLDLSGSSEDILRRKAMEDEAYLADYLNLIAERENTTQAQNWYERMSSSSYQRAMKDLENAGLNPVLALTSLSGAGSGSVQPAGFTNSNGFSTRVSEKISNKEMILRALGTGLTGLFGLLAIGLRKSR